MKKKATSKIIGMLNKKDVSEVRTLDKGAVKPRSLGFKWNQKKYTPDVVAVYPGKKDMFAIEEKITKKNISELITKWILFGLEARKQGGKFYLVVPQEKMAFCREIIDHKQLSAQLLNIES